MAFTVPNLQGSSPPSFERQSDLTRLEMEVLGQSMGAKSYTFSGGLVTVSSGMTLNVTAGAGQVGLALVSWAVANPVLANGDTTHPRRDIIYINNGGTVSVLAGTPAAYPLPSESFSVDSMSILAIVEVPAGATSITNANITDKRIVAPVNFHSTPMRISDFISSAGSPTSGLGASREGTAPLHYPYWGLGVDDEVVTDDLLVLPPAHTENVMNIWLQWVNPSATSGNVRFQVKLWEYNHSNLLTKAADDTMVEMQSAAQSTANALSSGFNAGGQVLSWSTNTIPSVTFDTNPILAKVSIKRIAASSSELGNDIRLVGALMLTRRPLF